MRLLCWVESGTVFVSHGGRFVPGNEQSHFLRVARFGRPDGGRRPLLGWPFLRLFSPDGLHQFFADGQEYSLLALLLKA
jgi:hypothetical protein